MENEEFFEPILVRISKTKTAQPIVEKIKNPAVVALPNNSETAAKEPIKEVVSEKNISVQPTTVTSTETTIPAKTEQKPNQLRSWVKMAIVAAIFLLLIFWVVSNL